MNYIGKLTRIGKSRIIELNNEVTSDLAQMGIAYENCSQVNTIANILNEKYPNSEVLLAQWRKAKEEAQAQVKAPQIKSKVINRSDKIPRKVSQPHLKIF